MKIYAMVVFDDKEREVLIRALQEHGHLLEGENKRGETVYPVRSFLGRIRQEEPLDGKALASLVEVVDACLDRLEPEIKVETWQKMGAPGSAEAVAGLAATRQHRFAELTAARSLVRQARDLVGPPPPTKNETREESVAWVT